MAKVAHLTSVHTCHDPRILYKECRTLAKAGYNVVLIAPHDRNEVIEDIRIRAIPKPRNRWERMTRTAWRVYRAALTEDADLYHFHDPELLPVGLLLKMRGRPVIYDLHEDYVTSFRQKKYLPSWFRRGLAGSWDRGEAYLTRPFDIILAEKYYAERFPQGITVLNYPLREHFPAPVSVKGPPSGLLYTGVVSEDRGALIHSQVVALTDDVDVHIVGRCSPVLAGRMRQMAGDGRDRLHIEGEGLHVPYRRLLEVYAHRQWIGGLALFPPTPHYLRKELTKFFEYMGAGIPVICSDFPVWRSLMENTEAGLCVDPLDPQAIVDTIRHLMENPAEVKRMGDNGRRAFETWYNWDSEAEKLTKLYGSLLG